MLAGRTAVIVFLLRDRVFGFSSCAGGGRHVAAITVRFSLESRPTVYTTEPLFRATVQPNVSFPTQFLVLTIWFTLYLLSLFVFN